MKIAVCTKEGIWTGVVYDATTPEITAHHASYGEMLRPVAALSNAGTDLAPDWIAEPLSMEERRLWAKAEVLQWAAAFGSQFTAGYTAEEVASWSAKAAAARAQIAGEPQPLIEAEANVTGEDPDKLARAILAKANAYEVIVARITGLRRITMASIDATEDADSVSAALKSALAKANDLIAELGL